MINRELIPTHESEPLSLYRPIKSETYSLKQNVMETAYFTSLTCLTKFSLCCFHYLFHHIMIGHSLFVCAQVFASDLYILCL